MFSSLPGFEPGIFWSVVRRVIHCATGPMKTRPAWSGTAFKFPATALDRGSVWQVSCVVVSDAGGKVGPTVPKWQISGPCDTDTIIVKACQRVINVHCANRYCSTPLLPAWLLLCDFPAGKALLVSAFAVATAASMSHKGWMKVAAIWKAECRPRGISSNGRALA